MIELMNCNGVSTCHKDDGSHRHRGPSAIDSQQNRLSKPSTNRRCILISIFIVKVPSGLARGLEAKSFDKK